LTIACVFVQDARYGDPACRILCGGESRRMTMKNVVIAMLLVFGVSSVAFACDAGASKHKSGTSTPVAPIAPAK
jgi:hypothetical protein